VASLKVVWEDNALNLLLDRDRYTRQSIRDEFRRDPLQAAIEFDPAQRGFVTFVANKRYSVVWYLDEKGEQALVRAVVPLTNMNAQGPALKEYIERVVEIESKGEITL
jgi:hypothetical protein